MKAIADASSLLIMMKHLNETDLLDKLDDMASLDLAVYEVGNGLWKWASLAETVDREEAKGLLEALKKIFSTPNFTVISWVNLDHLATLQLALESRITFYDASYITASISFKKPLVTEDEKLRQAAAEHTEVMSWKEI